MNLRRDRGNVVEKDEARTDEIELSACEVAIRGCDRTTERQNRSAINVITLRLITTLHTLHTQTKLPPRTNGSIPTSPPTTLFLLRRPFPSSPFSCRKRTSSTRTTCSIRHFGTLPHPTTPPCAHASRRLSSPPPAERIPLLLTYGRC